MKQENIQHHAELLCLICQSPQQDHHMEVPNRFKPEETFTLVRCSHCGFVFLYPRPDEKEIENYYEDEDYQPHQKDPKSFSEYIYQKVRVWNNSYKRRLIENLISKSSILDYGCGTGEFLLEMQHAGWVTYGFEPAVKAKTVAQQYGLRLLKSPEDLKTPVDVMTLWHVLEHVHQPISLLNQLKEYLSADGLLIIAVPNPRSVDSRMFGKNWVAYDAPRHLYHFRPKDIDSLLHSLGFKIIEYKGLYFDPWYNALLSGAFESHNKSLMKKIFIILKGIAAASLAFGEGLVSSKKSSSVIYIAKKEKL